MASKSRMPSNANLKSKLKPDVKPAARTKAKPVARVKARPVQIAEVKPKAKNKPKPADLAKSLDTETRLSKSNASSKTVGPGKKTIKSAKTGSNGLSGNKLLPGTFKKVNAAVAKQIMDRLCQQYPDARCELTYRNDFELLTAVILSAQTTDINVNKATPGLFSKFPDPKSLAEAPLDEVKNCVRSTGYYNAKAQNIQACAQGLICNFGGRVPKTVEELITLPGVGRKTANVVLGVIHNIPGWTVDTHVQRLSKRLGLSSQEDPLKIEQELQKLFPEQDWTRYSITLIWHGRRCCYARKPDCISCPVNQLCPSSEA